MRVRKLVMAGVRSDGGPNVKEQIDRLALLNRLEFRVVR